MSASKEKLSVAFVIMGLLFCVCLITSNLLETKLFLLFGNISLTCGFIVFPISYIINDCIAEVWGYAKARLIIWLGFIMNFFVVIMGAIACALPPLFPGSDTAFKEVFSFAPQIALASFTAFLVGSFLNAWVMSSMKLQDRGKGHFNWHFSARAVLSTIVGESADSLIFFPLAFYLFPLVVEGQPKVPVNVLITLMITQVIAKTLYEIAVLPITIRIVKLVKKYENTDFYDDDTSYNPLYIKQI